MSSVKRKSTSADRSPASRTTVCACDSAFDKTPCDGRKAVGVDQDIKNSNTVRLKRTEGQVRGIIKMIESDRYCTDIIIQIAAARESLRAVAKDLLKNHLKHCARAALNAGKGEADAMCDELMDVMSKLTR